MRKLLFLSVLSVFIFSSPVWAADVSGDWALTHTGPNGEENLDLNITADGSDLTITATHPQFGDIQGTGTLDGDNITMTIPTDMVTFEFEGTVKGDKMSGTRTIEMGGAPGGGGGAPGGAAPGGGEGGPPGGGEGGPSGGGAPGGGGGMDFDSIPNEWTAVRK